VFGAREESICWVTPVLDEHFSYHGSVLAGGQDTGKVLCFGVQGFKGFTAKTPTGRVLTWA
jgi:hypothetical protein